VIVALSRLGALVALVVGDVDQGPPIIVQRPGEWPLLFGVLIILGLPLYLAYRRGYFRRHTDR
jgi:hypothetical protein